MNKTKNKRHLRGEDIVNGKLNTPADMVKWFTMFAESLRNETNRSGNGTCPSMQNVYNAYLHTLIHTEVDNHE